MTRALPGSRPPTVDRPSRYRPAVAGAALAVAVLTALPVAASADPRDSGSVFVQLNSASGNAIAVYDRTASGALVAEGTVATGGKGGKAVGAPVDALASQGSLTLGLHGHVLLAVNAGSDTVTSFAVGRHRLVRRSVVPSRGSFPVSVTVHGRTVYVLNSGGAGSIAGFTLHDGRLRPIPGSTRSLGLSNTTPPAFLSAPAQIGFAADGRELVVTTKANGTLLTFRVFRDGLVSRHPSVTPSQGPVPFSFVTDRHGRLLVTQAGDGRLASYAFTRGGGLRAIGTSAATGGAALCWNVRVGDTVFGANAGSATISAWRVARDGRPSLVAPVAARTDAGPIDQAVSHDGRYLYQLSGLTGRVDVFSIASDGSLSRLPGVTGLPTLNATGGPEGIAAR